MTGTFRKIGKRDLGEAASAGGGQRAPDSNGGRRGERAPGGARPVSPEIAEIINSPSDAAVASSVRRVAEANPVLRQLMQCPGAVIVVEVPGPEWVSPVADAWRAVFGADAAPVDDGDEFFDFSAPQRSWCEFRRPGPARASSPDDGNGRVRLAAASGRPVLGFSPDPAKLLPRDLVRSADRWIAIPALDPEAIAAAAYAATGERPTEPIAAETARLVALEDLLLAKRPGEDADTYSARLLGLTRTRHPSPKLTLDDVFGMDEAVSWGRSLARDLADFRSGVLPWSGVDRGAVLGGPPGTGKTTFAQALAASCGVPLVLGSLARWQAAGHLGDLLKAMRKTFSEARQAAPCILFIDEIDAFGDRSSFSGDNKDYSLQVVNALLEELDGASGREGVVVIGACNNPVGLDPALKRSGRLDRLITVGLPSQEALAAILGHHLAPELADADLLPVAAFGVGSSGADAARWARGAKRRARHDGGRPVRLEDVLAEVRGERLAVSESLRRRMAFHEAGHALVSALFWPGSVVTATIRLDRWAGASVRFVPGEFTATRREAEQHMVQMLAGRAAEEEATGEPSGGAGGGAGSDLAQASMTAVAMITAYGLGERLTESGRRLLWLGPPVERQLRALLDTRPDVAEEAEAALGRAYDEARALVREHRDRLDRIAQLLLEKEVVDGRAVEVLAKGSALGGSGTARGPGRRAKRRSPSPPDPGWPP